MQHSRVDQNEFGIKEVD